MLILLEISEFLQKGRAKNVKALVAQALTEGLAPQTILEDGLLHGMAIIGEKFKNNEVFIPDVLVAARAMNEGTALLKPFLLEAGMETKGTAIIGTVKGDLHDIGKNLVRMMLESNGLTVIDLGVDVAAETFVEAAAQHNAKVVCCSALLTTTMPEMKHVIDAFVANGTRDSVKIMVGGAPVTQEFCDSIGADAYTLDATSAGKAALRFVS